MDHSLEGLAKERGAKYMKFEFTEAKRSPSDQNSQALPPQPETSPRGFREKSRVWVEPVNPDAAAAFAIGSPIAATVSPNKLVAPTGFSFFAGSLFLCIALLVLDTLSAGTFADLHSSGHLGVDRISEQVYRLPELSAPIVTFGIASVLSIGYYFSWMVRILARFFSRLFRRRRLGN